MIDIYLFNNDIKVADTVVYKAKNLLDVQEGELYYDKDFGIDLKRFLSPDIQIQNETFESYSLQKMAQWGINPVELVINEETFRQVFNYTVIEQKQEGLVR